MPKKNLVFIAISLIILALLVWYANPASFADIVAKSDASYLLAAVLVATLSICTRVMKWKVLLSDVKFSEMFPIQMFGIAVSNFTPGKIAEPIKAVVLKARKGYAVASSLPSIIWERIVDVITLIVFALVSLQFFGFQSRILLLSGISIILFAVLIVVLLFVLHSRNFGYRLFRALRRLPLINRLPDDFMKNFYECKIKGRKLIACVVLTFLAWLLDGAIFYLTMLALGVSITPIILVGIIALSVLIGIASTLPGGLGSTEAIMILLLGVIGVQAATAVAGVMLFRFLSFWYGVLVGGASFVYLSKKMDMKKII